MVLTFRNEAQEVDGVLVVIRDAGLAIIVSATPERINEITATAVVLKAPKILCLTEDAGTLASIGWKDSALKVLEIINE